MLADLLSNALGIAHALVLYYSGLCYFWAGGSLDTCQLRESRCAAVHLFTLAKTVSLWDAPHYRAASFAADLRENLKNVAIPGTGVPLSLFCSSRWMLLLFILAVNPVVTLIAAAYMLFLLPQHTGSSSGSSRTRTYRSLAEAFGELLLEPRHWFAVWRHNCLLMGWHELLTGSSSYRLEDKGVFLLEAAALGLPVSPFYEDAAAVFVKHKSVEGGMGIHVFRNFAHGGNWIIQPALSNSSFLSSMLPPSAPLSTLRVVTASIAWLESWLELQQQQEAPSNIEREHQQSIADFLRQAEQRVAQQEQRRAEQHLAHDAAGAAASPGHHHHGSGAGEAAADGGRQRLLAAGRRSPGVPRSTGVLAKRLIEGRSGTQFVEAVSSLAAEGLITDPALRRQPSSPGSSGLEANGHHQQQQQQDGADAAADGGPATSEEEQLMYAGRVEVVTVVWRAGLAGAATDHSSICFGIETDSGQLQRGLTANHYYRLGLRGVGRVDAAAHTVFEAHPDSRQQVAGRVIPDMAAVLDAVVQAHALAAPDLPLIGWDVALTQDGVSILEVNLSCNLFNGLFDRDGFYEFLFQYLLALSELEMEQRRHARHNGSSGCYAGTTKQH